MTAEIHACRGEILHFLGDPASMGVRGFEHFADGLLVIRDGRVAECGPHAELVGRLGRDTQLVDHGNALLLPGFVDTHVHYSQTDIIASPGADLLDWLQRYTYPAEQAFDDILHAREVATFFCDELLRNGTTTAACFGSIHTQSVDAVFEAAASRHMRFIAGKVLMDRHCPPGLCEDAQAGDAASRMLIERWHGRDRLHYAITPRFAPTSTPRQLQLAGALFAEMPGLYVQSHVAENRDEVQWAERLYPQARSYLDIYDRHALLGPRAIYGHAIWLDESDRARCAESDTAISFCPTSNLFLGSGHFDLAAARAHGIRIGMGSDLGGGTSFSMLRTLAGAYTSLRQRGQHLSALEGLYLATLGGARSLHLEDHIGSFLPGREADFVALDLAATPLLARRCGRAQSLEERLFALMLLGDERCVKATHILGRQVSGRANDGIQADKR